MTIDLSPTEYKLLRYLMDNEGRVLSKAQILDHVWQYDWGGDAAIVESYISYLRKKVDDVTVTDEDGDHAQGDTAHRDEARHRVHDPCTEGTEVGEGTWGNSHGAGRRSFGVTLPEISGERHAVGPGGRSRCQERAILAESAAHPQITTSCRAQ